MTTNIPPVCRALRFIGLPCAGLPPVRVLSFLVSLTILCSASAARAQSGPASVVGEIPFRYIDHNFLDVTLNDSLDAVLLYDPVRGVILDERFARASGLRSFGGEEVGYGGPVHVGGAGSQRHLVTFTRDLHVRNDAGDGIVDRVFPLAPVIPLDSMMAVSVGRTVDGLFGIDILAEHVLEFDFQRERLVLHDTTSFTPPDGAAGLPITPMGGGGKPTIPVTIHLASGDAIDGQFILDFGMGGIFRLTTGFTNEHGFVDRVSPTVAGSESGLGGALESRVGRVPGVTMGSIRIDAPPLSLAQETAGADAYPEWDGLIGLGLLERFRVFYDAPGAQLWLLPTEASHAPFPFIRTGLGWEPVGRHSGGLVVRTIRDESAAVAAGLVPGDRLVSVGGEDASGWTRRQWGKAVDAAALAGRPLELSFLRGSKRLSVKLTVEPLL